MDFLVEFQVIVPEGTPAATVDERNRAEAAAAADLARDGHLVRLWREPVAPGETRAVGLYRADDDAQLDGLLGALPLYDWMHLTVTPLSPHPNDPEAINGAQLPLPPGLPLPRLTRVFRLDASVGEPLELGVTAQGRRRIVPLTAGSFDSSLLGSGTLVPGVSADWQTVLADGTALGDIRYTLRTEAGHLLDVRSRSVRHGSADVLARLAEGEPVDPHEYTFRAATQIETGEPSLAWANKGVFVSVGARDAPASPTRPTWWRERRRVQRGGLPSRGGPGQDNEMVPGFAACRAVNTAQPSQAASARGRSRRFACNHWAISVRTACPVPKSVAGSAAIDATTVELPEPMIAVCRTP
jgi:muconolactone delta-isomerase